MDGLKELDAESFTPLNEIGPDEEEFSGFQGATATQDFEKSSSVEEGHDDVSRNGDDQHRYEEQQIIPTEHENSLPEPRHPSNHNPFNISSFSRDPQTLRRSQRSAAFEGYFLCLCQRQGTEAEGWAAKRVVMEQVNFHHSLILPPIFDRGRTFKVILRYRSQEQSGGVEEYTLSTPSGRGSADGWVGEFVSKGEGFGRCIWRLGGLRRSGRSFMYGCIWIDELSLLVDWEDGECVCF